MDRSCFWHNHWTTVPSLHTQSSCCAASVLPRMGGRLAFAKVGLGPRSTTQIITSAMESHCPDKHMVSSLSPRLRLISSTGPCGDIDPRVGGHGFSGNCASTPRAVSVRGRALHPHPRSLKPRLWGSRRERDRETYSPSLPCEWGARQSLAGRGGRLRPHAPSRGALGGRLSPCTPPPGHHPSVTC